MYESKYFTLFDNFYSNLILWSLLYIGTSIFLNIVLEPNTNSLSSEKLENREEICYNDDTEI